MLKIGIDIDDTITATNNSKAFFSLITNLMRSFAKVYIITNRETDDLSRGRTEEELGKMNIHYDELVITAEKADFILKEGISIYFDDTDEYFNTLPESVTVCKIREYGNFDFADNKWIYGDKTGKHWQSK